MLNTRTAGLTVTNLGSIFLFEPRTSAAVTWVEEHLPKAALTFGDAVVVEHRYNRSRRRPRGSRTDLRRATWVTSDRVELDSRA